VAAVTAAPQCKKTGDQGPVQLSARRANYGGYGCRPLHQCVGKEGSQHSLKHLNY